MASCGSKKRGMPEREMDGWAADAQRDIEHKAPNTKLQAPVKLQTPDFKCFISSNRAPEVWNLMYPRGLWPGVGSFPAVWNFFAFISKISSIAHAELESA